MKKPKLPDAARRALDEAEQRRQKQREAEAQQEAIKSKPQKELSGRDGLDPVRYGDWEKKGIAVDF